MLLNQALQNVAIQNMGRPALRYLNKDLSYQELLNKIGKLSYLFQHEFQHGKRVAFLTRNSPAVVASFFAFSNTQSLVIPVNPDLPYDQIAVWIKEARADLIAITDDLRLVAQDLKQKGQLPQPIVNIEKKQGGEYDTHYTAPAEHTPKPSDPVLLLRTAGTTGPAKFVAFNHEQLAGIAMTLKRPYRLSGVDRVITFLNWSFPFGWIHGMLLPILSGATCVIDHGLQSQDLLPFLLENRITRIVDTPLFFRKLLLICRTQEQTLPMVRSITIGMGTLPAAVRRIYAMLKIKVAAAYGQTEAGWALAMEEARPDDKPKEEELGNGGTDEIKGLPLPGVQYKILDPAGDPIEKGDVRIGRLAVMGPQIMSGYDVADKDEAKKLSQSVLRGTWLYTGDIVKTTGDGDEMRMSFLGRQDELLEKEGQYTDPKELDHHLSSIPGVVEGAGFVTVNRVNKPVICCVVVKKQGSSVSENSVKEHLKTHVPAPLMPDAIFLTDLIPKGPGGAILRTRLRTQYGGMA